MNYTVVAVTAIICLALIIIHYIDRPGRKGLPETKADPPMPKVPKERR